MASGSTHRLDSVVLFSTSALASAGAFVFGYLDESTLVLGAAHAVGCLAGAYLTPDLDVDGATVVDSLPGGRIVRWFFMPYSWTVPHRSWVSHLPVVSTLIRQLYIMLWVGGVALIWLPWEEIQKGLELVVANPLYLCFFVGLCLSDLFHWIRDW